jgi:hypothetical protein
MVPNGDHAIEGQADGQELRMSRTAPASSLAFEKARARAAFQTACEIEPTMSPTFRRWWSETLQATEGRPPDVRVLMFRRTSTLYGLLVDRAGWPEGRIR